jgi:beta-glucosidase
MTIRSYYGMPVGTDLEEVGFAFSRGVITDLLRTELGFRGIVCTDWGLLTDTSILGQDMPARAWGVEHLSDAERALKILNAGCDQFGGESRPELVVQLVQEKKLLEARLDESVRRLLREKFILGLFEQPFTDPESAVSIVGNAEFQREADIAQRRSITMLTNDNVLPLRPGEASTLKVYVEGILPDLVSAQGFTIVEDPKAADLALLRLKAPYEPRPGGFEAHFHAGSLEYSQDAKSRQTQIFAEVPRVIVDVYLDRPAVISEIAEQAAALLVNYGSSADAFLDVVLGQAAPEGKLPFDLPRSMQAVRESREDLQYDTKDPLFRFGHGLKYSLSRED